MITHSGVKPFQCRFCAYRATQQSNLNRHVRTVHSNEPRYDTVLDVATDVAHLNPKSDYDPVANL